MFPGESVLLYADLVRHELRSRNPTSRLIFDDVRLDQRDGFVDIRFRMSLNHPQAESVEVWVPWPFPYCSGASADLRRELSMAIS